MTEGQGRRSSCASTRKRALGGSAPFPSTMAAATSLMITSDGRRLVAVGEGETFVRDAQNLSVAQRWPVGGRALSPAALAPDDRTVAIGGQDGSVRLLDVESGEQRQALGRHVAEVFGARFTPDGRTLVTTGADSDVILWDVQRAAASETLSGQPGRVLTPQITTTAGPSTRPARARRYSSGTSSVPGASAARSAPVRPLPSPVALRSCQARPSSR